MEIAPTSVLSWLQAPTTKALVLSHAPCGDGGQGHGSWSTGRTLRIGAHPLTLFLQDHLDDGEVHLRRGLDGAEAVISFPAPSGAGCVAVSLPHWTHALLDVQMQITTPRQWDYFRQLASAVCRAATHAEANRPDSETITKADNRGASPDGPSEALQFRFDFSAAEFSAWLSRELFSMFATPAHAWIGAETNTNQLLMRYLADVELPPLHSPFSYRLSQNVRSETNTPGFSATLIRCEWFAPSVLDIGDQHDERADEQFDDPIDYDETFLLTFSLPGWVRRLAYLGPVLTHDHWKRLLTQLATPGESANLC